MRYDESLEYFLDCFLHFYYEFFEEDIDWAFMNEKIQHLVQIYLEPLESKSMTSLPYFLGHGELKISKEESNIFHVPSPIFFFLIKRSIPMYQ